MRTIEIRLRELAFVAATRGMAGAGVGLLASNSLSWDARRKLGWTLFTLGALPTIPIALVLRSRARGQDACEAPDVG